jgi:hypothetical protein
MEVEDMSLTMKQMDDTRRELRENFKKSGLTVQQIATDLATTPEYIEQLLRLEPRSYDHTWILRNYLYENVKKAGKTPTEFTALKGSHRNYWFLNADFIERGKISYP